MTSITIPNSVTSIGSNAFYWCSLKKVTIPNSVTSIESNTFFGCNLKKITIPNSVKSIGKSAFEYCEFLTNINYKGTMEQWGKIEKGSFWSYHTGDFTITCTDGVLDEDGNQI